MWMWVCRWEDEEVLMVDEDVIEELPQTQLIHRTAFSILYLKVYRAYACFVGWLIMLLLLWLVWLVWLLWLVWLTSCCC